VSVCVLSESSNDQRHTMFALTMFVSSKSPLNLPMLLWAAPLHICNASGVVQQRERHLTGVLGLHGRLLHCHVVPPMWHVRRLRLRLRLCLRSSCYCRESRRHEGGERRATA
jgi:hypothetical protein